MSRVSAMSSWRVPSGQMGFLPCTSWSSWQYTAVRKYGFCYLRTLQGRWRASLRRFATFVELATIVKAGGGEVILEWPVVRNQTIHNHSWGAPGGPGSLLGLLGGSQGAPPFHLPPLRSAPFSSTDARVPAMLTLSPALWRRSSPRLETAAMWRRMIGLTAFLRPRSLQGSSLRLTPPEAGQSRGQRKRRRIGRAPQSAQRKNRLLGRHRQGPGRGSGSFQDLADNFTSIAGINNLAYGMIPGHATATTEDSIPSP